MPIDLFLVINEGLKVLIRVMIGWLDPC